MEVRSMELDKWNWNLAKQTNLNCIDILSIESLHDVWFIMPFAYEKQIHSFYLMLWAFPVPDNNIAHPSTHVLASAGSCWARTARIRDMSQICDTRSCRHGLRFQVSKLFDRWVSDPVIHHHHHHGASFSIMANTKSEVSSSSEEASRWCISASCQKG